MAKVIKLEQSSELWRRERGWRVSASRFGDVIAGTDTKRYKDYLSELVDARKGFVSNLTEGEEPWYQHGKAFEPRARSAYEWQNQVEITHDFMLIHSEHDYISASPDGAPIDLSHMKTGEIADIDIPYTLEIKGRQSIKTYEKSLREGLASHYKPQVQGQLWLSGAEYADYVNYYEEDPTPDRPKGLRRMNVISIEPDPEYHSFLEEKCMMFELEIRNQLTKDRA